MGLGGSKEKDDELKLYQPHLFPSFASFKEKYGIADGTNPHFYVEGVQRPFGKKNVTLKYDRLKKTHVSNLQKKAIDEDFSFVTRVPFTLEIQSENQNKYPCHIWLALRKTTKTLHIIIAQYRTTKFEEDADYNDATIITENFKANTNPQMTKRYVYHLCKAVKNSLVYSKIGMDIIKKAEVAHQAVPNTTKEQKTPEDAEAVKKLQEKREELKKQLERQQFELTKAKFMSELHHMKDQFPEDYRRHYEAATCSTKEEA